VCRRSIVAVFGRVPLFFHIVHLYLVHVLGILITFVVTGSLNGDGFDLWMVYAVWLVDHRAISRVSMVLGSQGAATQRLAQLSMTYPSHSR
jgi:hypothetical protein